MAALIAKDLVSMYKHTQPTWKKNHTKSDLRPILDYRPEEVLIHKEEPKGDAMFELTGVMIIQKKPFKFRVNVIGEDQPYVPNAFGKWGVNPISFQVAKIIEDEEAEL